MKQALRVWIFLMLCAGCSAKEPAVVFQPQFARSNILAALPSGWSIISQPSSQWEDFSTYFTDSRTDVFILLGPNSCYIDWTDKHGAAHRDYLAKECLYILVAPPDFTPSFPHWWIDPPKQPERVFASKKFKVYGYDTDLIEDTNRWQTIQNEATEFSSPASSLSWTHWRKDIAASLKK